MVRKAPSTSPAFKDADEGEDSAEPKSSSAADAPLSVLSHEAQDRVTEVAEKLKELRGSPDPHQIIDYLAVHVLRLHVRVELLEAQPGPVCYCPDAPKA